MKKKKRKGGQRIPVIFRMFKGKHNYPARDCIALFPTICDDYTGNTCMSYVQIGQHSSADPLGLMSVVDATTRPATKAEYKELAAELRAIGYRYKIYKRQQPAWREMRVKQASQHRKDAQENPAGMPWSPKAREEAQRPV